jgi:hypothetical protein
MSAEMGETIFSSRLAHTRTTKHEAAHAETEAVAEERQSESAQEDIWPDCENGHVKEAFAGLDMRNANNGAPYHYRSLYLELRQR